MERASLNVLDDRLRAALLRSLAANRSKGAYKQGLRCVEREVFVGRNNANGFQNNDIKLRLIRTSDSDQSHNVPRLRA